ncbi:MAG: hypothetical protein ABIH11_07115 [Candidatus Altiarchaeota archaeon]
MGKTAVDYVRKWDGEPLIVYGGSGSGKSLLAQLTAVEKGWDMIEVDDSNINEAESIASTSSLYGGRRLVIIEDVDLIRDIKKISEFVASTKSPVLMTTQDYGSKRLSTLKRKCLGLQLRKPMVSSVVKHLQGICAAEGLDVDKSVLEAIAKNAKCDLRASVNDLETLGKGRKAIREEDLDVLAKRDIESDIYRALSVIFGGKDIREVVESTWNIQEQPRDVIWWVDENVPYMYVDGKSVSESMEKLSRADVFLGRIMNRQYWGFLRYANALMTAGVNNSRPDKTNYSQYRFPSYFAALGRTKGVRNIEKSISEKLSPTLHASRRVISQEYIPLLKLLLKKRIVESDEVKEFFRLEDEEVEHLVS